MKRARILAMLVRVAGPDTAPYCIVLGLIVFIGTR